MTQTYPVRAYRTAQPALERGFQTFEDRFLRQPFRSVSSPSTRDLELLLQQAFRPSAPSSPIRTGAGTSIVPRVARSSIHLGGTALTRHPVFRIAEAAWQAGQFLHPPATAPVEGSETITLNGYSHCVTCSSDAPTIQNAWSTNGCWMSCLQNQAVSNQQPVGAAVPSTTDSIIWWKPAASGFVNRWDMVRAFGKSGSSPRSTLSPQRSVSPDQPSLPFGEPMPMPVPYRLAPRRRNSALREAGYGPSTSTKHRRSPPGGQLPTRFAGAKHRRPGKKEQERKFSLMSGGKLRNLIEAAFEGTEWVQDLHDALPKDCQANGTVAENFVAVASCLHRLDVCKAVENRINNHIEDKVIGVLGQAAKKSAIGSGKSYGIAGITKKLGKPYFAEDGSLQFDPTLPFSIPKVSICG